MKERSTWSHWENTAAGVVAVFHYEVPKTASHYEIDTPVEQIQHNTGSNRWAPAGGDGCNDSRPQWFATNLAIKDLCGSIQLRGQSFA